MRKSCKPKTCLKRHPKPCRYGQKCRRKETCDYRHDPSTTENDLKAEIEALKITIKHILEESKNTKTKLAAVENELKTFKEGASVKDTHPEENESTVSSEIEEFALSKKSIEAKIGQTNIKETVLFWCTDCSRRFSSQSLLTKHEKNCVLKKLFKCKTCNIEFKLDNHIFFPQDQL